MFACFEIARTVNSPTEACCNVSSAASRIAFLVTSLRRSERLASFLFDSPCAIVSDCMTQRSRWQGGAEMSKQAVVVRRGEAETLHVMGAGVRFLCEADKTDKAWSLMEVVVPMQSG